MQIKEHNMNTYDLQDVDKAMYYPAGCSSCSCSCSCSCCCSSAASTDVEE